MKLSHLAIALALLFLVHSAEISFVGKPLDNKYNIRMSNVLSVFRQTLGELSEHDIRDSAMYIQKLAQGSFLKPVSKIVVVLAQSIPEEHSSLSLLDYARIPAILTSIASGAQFVQSWEAITEQVSAPISVLDMTNASLSDIKSLLEKDVEGIAKVVIGASPSEHYAFMSAVSKAASKRVLQQTAQEAESNAYLIKFFFSIIFILVSAATLYSILDMKNTRDTLLYAKFIADVGH